jgi:hypothetical protein
MARLTGRKGSTLVRIGARRGRHAGLTATDSPAGRARATSGSACENEGVPRYFDLRSTVLIVVGHGILPEEEDRPFAYELKRAINARAGGSEGRAGVVVTDVWIMSQELEEFFPAIAVGNPTVNAFTAQLYEDLPLAWNRGEAWTRLPRARPSSCS